MTIQIPEYFLRKAARQFGDAGPGWVRHLPSYLARCEDQWQLTECVPADNLSINLVCYAHSVMYGDVVLKIEGPHTERYTEMIALRLYAGRHACTSFAMDEEIGAILLERIVPGYDLRKIPDKREQLEIGAEVIAKLPIPLDKMYGLPYYGDWVTRAIATTHAQYHPSPRMIAMMDATADLFYKIFPGDEPHYLLHGDLHHENMLRHSDGEWKIIDPQGVIGAPFMESGRFIQNHVIDQDNVFHWDTLDDTVAYFATRLGESKYTIASAFFILHVLSTCWGYEMNYEDDCLARLIDEREGVLKYVREV
ncbi:MAG: hypothetical protein JXR84_16435 [Anaerolineae bacterium]|nr:hypothetical protein [Anaerolineae bacterium]